LIRREYEEDRSSTLCTATLHVYVINKGINLFVGQIVLDTEKCERTAWLSRRRLRLFKALQDVLSDYRRNRLTAPLNNDMLPPIRDFSD